MFYMYEHPFCKVVTSAKEVEDALLQLYMHRFCKVVTSAWAATPPTYCMYEHPFCKVVTSGQPTSRRWPVTCMSIIFVRLLHPLVVLQLLAVACMSILFVRLLHPPARMNRKGAFAENANK